ncbi:MAG: dihydrofolate reductase [Patescibacteria group bacterium]|nr:dihydrofolate reductase [Patescibacteria group bacterium]MDE2588151.1 dihydrofolate reductase [Patescibacteria group bacterium]
MNIVTYGTIVLMTPRISAIAAIGENRELGRNNQLLWHIPGELARFKEITMGHPIIMGRKTFESIGRVLPGRANIIITRDASYKVKGAFIVESVEKATEVAKEQPGGDSEIFVIGGGQIFKETIPMTDRLYLTIVHKSYPDADVYYPEYPEFTNVISTEDKQGQEFAYTFLTLDRG